MPKKLLLLLTGSLAGVAILISSLSAADAPAAPAMAPAEASASAKPAAPAASAAPMMAAAPARPKADMSKVPAASDKKDLTFDKDIEPILKASCVGCHSGARPKGGLDFTSKENALKGGRGSKTDIVPGHGDQSNLLLFASDAVTKSEMPPLSARTRTTPPPEPALTKDQLALIRAWIDQGAK